MKYEYLIFNLVVLSGPAFFAAMRSFWFYDRLPRVIPAIILPAIPFIAWDALVTGAHWHFNPEYVLGIYWFGLPLEEWLFFVTVPFAWLL